VRALIAPGHAADDGAGETGEQHHEPYEGVPSRSEPVKLEELLRATAHVAGRDPPYASLGP
jgi:hypothetical protein